MSRFEQIFFATELPLSQARRTVATALRLQQETVRDDEVLHSAPPPGLTVAVAVAGTVEPNVYAETDPHDPSETSIFDDMPYVFELQVSRSDLELQAETALVLYRRMVEALHWRSALTSEYATLVASYDDEHGYREFPPDTLSDGSHADRWR